MKKLGVVAGFVLVMALGFPVPTTFGRDFANPEEPEEAESDYYFEVKFIGRCQHAQSGQVGVCLFLYHPQKKYHLAIFFQDGRPQIVLGQKPGEPVKELYVSDWYGTF